MRSLGIILAWNIGAFAAVGILLGSGIAGQGPARGDRETWITTQATRQAEQQVLREQLARWEQVRNKDWEEVQRQARIYDQYVKDNPTWPVDRSGAEANQAKGRVAAADRLLDDIRRRLAQVGPLESPPVAKSPEEVTAVDLAAKQAEHRILSGLYEPWQQIREADWEEVQRQSQTYNQHVKDNPNWPIDRSAAEANQARGRVEWADRFMAETKRRIEVLNGKIAEAKVSVREPVPVPAPATNKLGSTTPSTNSPKPVDVSGTWEILNAGTDGRNYVNVSTAGGQFRATCSYTVKGKPYRWTMTATMTPDGKVVGEQIHSALPNPIPHAMQLSADGRKFTGTFGTWVRP